MDMTISTVAALPRIQKALRLFAPLALCVLAACSSGVTRSADMALAKPQFASGTKAGDISIALAPEAQKQAVDNLTFNQDALLATVRRALQATGVLTNPADPTLPKIDIMIADIRTRSTFSAIMFGFMAGDDHIKGEVVVRNSSGVAVQQFTVNASYALGGLAGGQDGARMDWLYEAFAKRVLEELKGISNS
jgi:Domain of unknown function (DUF4410)